jgi:hypothetical protein
LIEHKGAADLTGGTEAAIAKAARQCRMEARETDQGRVETAKVLIACQSHHYKSGSANVTAYMPDKPK